MWLFAGAQNLMHVGSRIPNCSFEVHAGGNQLMISLTLIFLSALPLLLCLKINEKNIFGEVYQQQKYPVSLLPPQMSEGSNCDVIS